MTKADLEKLGRRLQCDIEDQFDVVDGIYFHDGFTAALELLWPVVNLEWHNRRLCKYECSGENHSYPCLQRSEALAKLEGKLK